MSIRSLLRSHSLIFLATALCLSCAALSAPAEQSKNAIPSIAHKGDSYALIVDGAPFFMLGMQANNSSNYPAMLPKVWQSFDQLHANTLEIPVAWEQIEPVEGQFDFSYLDALLAQAREHHARLVLLWFATWKNNNPGYTPQWVKLDNKRFPRVIAANGETRNSLSPHFDISLQADRKAFSTLMRHLKQVDPEHTVIMVQVENETGTYNSVRDYSDTAQKLFAGNVPEVVLKALHKQPGTWKSVFGKDADEFFYAWSMGRYVQQVAEAGKKEYPLPMYVNVALRDPFKYQDPITYSSGGPTWNVLDIWKAAAPSIDVIGPDIYESGYDYYTRTLEQYSRPDNALYVPESGNKPEYARYFYEVMGRGGIGFSPFGLDYTGYSNFPLGAANVDSELMEVFAHNYKLVEPMMRELAALSFAGKVWGAAEPTDVHQQTLALSNQWQAIISYGRPSFGRPDPTGNPTPRGGAMIAELAKDEYLVFGFQSRVEFAHPVLGSHVIFARVEEGHYENGKWIFERVWNGDQADSGLNFTSLPQVLRVKLASF